MIIKLSDGDVTVAQDSLDDAGIIHIPENVWDHIVQEVQHPDQSFVNELYINVQDLNIGSSSGGPAEITQCYVCNSNNEMYGSIHLLSSFNYNQLSSSITINVATNRNLVMIKPIYENNVIVRNLVNIRTFFSSATNVVIAGGCYYKELPCTSDYYMVTFDGYSGDSPSEPQFLMRLSDSNRSDQNSTYEVFQTSLCTFKFN